MRRMWLAFTYVVAAAAVATALFAADWPGWRGQRRDGYSLEKGINKGWKAKPPKELWRIPLGDIGHAGPAVAGGKVFIVDHQKGDDVVRAIDAATGKDVWTYAYADGTGEDYGFTRSTPLIEGGKVYVISMMGKVLCLDEKDGKVVWEKSLIADLGGRKAQWHMSMSAIIDGDKLIVVPGAKDGAVAALNKDTGELIWKGGGSDIPGYSTPVVLTPEGKKLYVVFLGTSLVGVDAEDGKLLWSLEWKTKYDVNAATPVVIGDAGVFITSGYGRGCALLKVSARGVEKIWENKNVQAHFNSAVFAGAYLYANSDPDDLVCLDVKTGKTVWKQDGFEKGGLLSVNGCIIAQSGSRGTLVLCRMTPDGYQELGRIDAFPKCRKRAWAPPIVADMKLFARDLKELVCYDLH